MQPYRELLDAAIEAAQLAANHIRSVERPADPSMWGEKGTSDFVTQVDRDCETIIAETLLRAYPSSVVMGEELSPRATGTTEGITWVVDPLDGTTNYLHNYPAYAVSVAAIANGVLSAGVVVDVLREKVYQATAGGGAWCGGARLSTSVTDDEKLALIGTGFPFKQLNMLPAYQRQFAEILTSTSGIRRSGSAALDLVDLACGRLDGFWELSLAPWDVAAGTLMVREAGGVVTDADGSSEVIRQGPVIAGNSVIHGWMMEVIDRYRV